MEISFMLDDPETLEELRWELKRRNNILHGVPVSRLCLMNNDDHDEVEEWLFDGKVLSSVDNLAYSDLKDEESVKLLDKLNTLIE